MMIVGTEIMRKLCADSWECPQKVKTYSYVYVIFSCMIHSSENMFIEFIYFLQILRLLTSLELVLGPLYLILMFVMAMKLSSLSVDLMKESIVITMMMLASDVLVVRKVRYHLS